ncbi:5-carboxymethyl-2-hydroxymuconate Delta-isomerase [Shewanella atlantica]|uniref:5-carboxymethyl-2-hydroxymuconate Delta-isomerase n=1 Tax=Shewanella atlantica TaxID=271099 RepID=UPI003735DC33
MPHCIIEYSAPLADKIDIKHLIQRVHHGAIDAELFERSAIKTRAIRCEDYQVGDNHLGSFIHITIKIMPGRTDEQKNHLLTTVYDSIAAETSCVCSLTLEVIDINAKAYAKHLTSGR